jgi:RecJ-like exonuclease
MTNSFECFKCSGKGKIEAFSHIENGDCFQCCGTGRLMTREQRAKLAAANSRKKLDAHDRRCAKECGLSLEEFRHISDPKRYPRAAA